MYKQNNSLKKKRFKSHKSLLPHGKLFIFDNPYVEAEKVSVGYLIKDNILMRKWSLHNFIIAPLFILKEKWLDEDPEKISVLKYVATFKDRLFRAGQVDKRNLQ